MQPQYKWKVEGYIIYLYYSCTAEILLAHAWLYIIIETKVVFSVIANLSTRQSDEYCPPMTAQ